MILVTALITTSLLTVDVRIEQVLPENTIAVMSANNVSLFMAHLKEIGACDAVCDIVQSAMSTDEESPITQACSEMKNSFDQEDLSLPNGHVGMGLYPVVDFEVGLVGLGALFMVEVENDKFGKIIQSAIDQYSGMMEFDFEMIDISGRDVWIVQNDFTEITSQILIPIDISSMTQWYFAYADGYLLFGTEPEGFASVFSALDGEPLEESLATNDDYLELMERCGQEGDMQAAVLLTNLADTFLQMDTSGMGMTLLPMAKTVIGDIDGLAQTVSFSSSKDTILEGKYTILMRDGRNGLMSLLAVDSPQSKIPSFVGEDTISYTQASINYDKVVPLVNEIISSNPLLSMQISPQMVEEFGTSISMFTSNLGRQTHYVTAGTIPYSADSHGTLVAIECLNEEQFSSALGMMLPSLGATPVDFLGNQIFTIDLGSSAMMPIPMEMSFSIAVGGGYLLVGNSNAVENALRAIANPKESKSNHGMNDAADLLASGNYSGWGYGDPLKNLEIQTAVFEESNEAFFAEMEEYDPEMAAEMRADAAGENSLQDSILKTLSLFLGPMSWNMSTDDKGFTAEILMLKP